MLSCLPRSLREGKMLLELEGAMREMGETRSPSTGSILELMEGLWVLSKAEVSRTMSSQACFSSFRLPDAVWSQRSCGTFVGYHFEKNPILAHTVFCNFETKGSRLPSNTWLSQFEKFGCPSCYFITEALIKGVQSYHLKGIIADLRKADGWTEKLYFARRACGEQQEATPKQGAEYFHFDFERLLWGLSSGEMQ